MIVATSLEEFDRWRLSDAPCVLVPTMGALHEGHASIIRQGAALAAKHPGGACVVTIFVNPTQFNDPADFARYPKTFDADVALCEAAGAGVVLAPPVNEVYPPDHAPRVPPLPRVATAPGLEDRFRPGHFAGVCQVVARLFDLTRPVEAVFGEKDWQQLRVVAAMAERTHPAVRIVPGETVREPDGLAMSSRNRFLSPAERQRAAGVSRALRESLRAPTAQEAETTMRGVLAEVGADVEYAVVRDALTLEPGGPEPSTPGAAPAMRALIAARFGATRLIDNALWTPGAGGVPLARHP
ncbi:MAG: pantoate--beta-alanine ligase [Planctomycetota bacterium]|nr:pantoate--beta-alanine ligase [Planctomycetota bacterium]